MAALAASVGGSEGGQRIASASKVVGAKQPEAPKEEETPLMQQRPCLNSYV